MVVRVMTTLTAAAVMTLIITTEATVLILSSSITAAMIKLFLAKGLREKIYPSMLTAIVSEF